MKFCQIFLVILLAGLHYSCEDWLELLPPDGLVEDEYWQKKEDVEAVMMGAYQKFAALNDELFLYGELRGDMLEIHDVTEYQAEIIFGNIIPDNKLCKWNDFYEIINLCNYVLKYTEKVKEVDNTMTEFQMKAYEAEAIFLRSMTYFYLVRIFKDVPLVLEPTDSDGVDLFPSKSTDTTVLNFIKEDLKTALTKVREDYGTIEDNKGRANKGAINALIADIALWSFEYEECMQYISNIEKMTYELLLPGDYYRLYYLGNSLESIFEIQFDQSLDQPNSLYPLIRKNNGYYRASINASEILSPEFTGEIIRGYASLGLVRENEYIIWKYQGIEPDGQSFRGGGINKSANWIIYRYADILLMKAEALSQKANPDYEGALEIINEVRLRSLMNPLNLPDNPVAFEDAILEERAKELSYEGKRWFDLVRMGRRNNFVRKDNLIKIIIEDVSSAQKLVLASKLTDPNGWYFPIHFEELEANANIKQNPYYEAYQLD